MENQLVVEKTKVYFVICYKVKCNFYNIYRPIKYIKGTIFNNTFVYYGELYLPILTETSNPKVDKLAYNIISEKQLMSMYNCESEKAAEMHFKNLNYELYIQNIDGKSKKHPIMVFNKDYFYNYPLSTQISDKIEPKSTNNILELLNYVKENVIGQDEAIKRILTILDYNENVLSYRNKNNILLIGPSGSGKTEIFRTIGELTDKVICIEDMGQYTTAGYKGADIENMLVHLYIKADKDLEKAEHGILVLDEIDKKITSDKSDPSGTRVIDSLLKLMEGTDFEITIEKAKNEKTFTFNTSNLTIVMAGAFVELAKRPRNDTGFNSTLNKNKLEYSEINTEKLSRYGFPHEALRRINIISLNELTIENLLSIIKDSKYSVLKEYINYFKIKKVKLNITDEALEVIASQAYDLQIGASGIKAIIDKLLFEAMFEVGINPNYYDEVKIDRDSIGTIPPYKLIHKKIN